MIEPSVADEASEPLLPSQDDDDNDDNFQVPSNDYDPTYCFDWCNSLVVSALLWFSSV